MQHGLSGAGLRGLIREQLEHIPDDAQSAIFERAGVKPAGRTIGACLTEIILKRTLDELVGGKDWQGAAALLLDATDREELFEDGLYISDPDGAVNLLGRLLGAGLDYDPPDAEIETITALDEPATENRQEGPIQRH